MSRGVVVWSAGLAFAVVAAISVPAAAQGGELVLAYAGGARLMRPMEIPCTPSGGIDVFLCSPLKPEVIALHGAGLTLVGGQTRMLGFEASLSVMHGHFDPAEFTYLVWRLGLGGRGTWPIARGARAHVAIALSFSPYHEDTPLLAGLRRSVDPTAPVSREDNSQENVLAGGVDAGGGLTWSFLTIDGTHALSMAADVRLQALASERGSEWAALWWIGVGLASVDR